MARGKVSVLGLWGAKGIPQDRQPSYNHRERNDKGASLHHGMPEHPHAHSALHSLLYYPIAQGINCFFKRLAPFHRTGRQGDNTDDPTEIYQRQRLMLAEWWENTQNTRNQGQTGYWRTKRTTKKKKKKSGLIEGGKTYSEAWGRAGQESRWANPYAALVHTFWKDREEATHASLILRFCISLYSLSKSVINIVHSRIRHGS